MKNIVIKTVLLLSLVYLISCGEDNDRNADNFDRTLILENFANNIIIPAYNTLALNSKQLEEDIVGLAAAPGQEVIEKARASWKTTKISWSKAEAFGFGPIDALAVETKINSWPLNDFGLEAFISSKTTVTTDDVAAMPSNQIGFNAIEYLLFGDEALSKLENNPVRLALLQALSTSLNTTIESIQNEWQGDYKAVFIAANGKDLGSSMTLLGNSFVESVEVMRTFKVSTPLGFRTEGVIQPGLVEAKFSSFSKELIAANLEAYRNIFNGQSDSGNLNGFDDYLNGLNISFEDELLSDVIDEQFVSSIEAVNKIEGSLQNAVVNNPLQVNDALTEMQKLIVLLKTDMMSQLGLIVTFSDNDGD